LIENQCSEDLLSLLQYNEQGTESREETMTAQPDFPLLAPTVPTRGSSITLNDIYIYIVMYVHISNTWSFITPIVITETKQPWQVLVY